MNKATFRQRTTLRWTNLFGLSGDFTTTLIHLIG